MVDFHLLLGLERCGNVMPLAILLIENDEDRAFLTSLYIKQRKLMYKTARKYFGADYDEIDDAVSSSIERMCRYCKNLQFIPEPKRAAYIVRIVENVCRTRIRAKVLERNQRAFSLEDDLCGDIASPVCTQETIFERMYAEDLLKSFAGLSYKDRELISMRHIDQMSFDEMAKALNMSEGAVRTALSRAKRRLEKQAAACKEGE